MMSDFAIISQVFAAWYLRRYVFGFPTTRKQALLKTIYTVFIPQQHKMSEFVSIDTFHRIQFAAYRPIKTLNNQPILIEIVPTKVLESYLVL
ncbi:hypothetical protein ACFL17_04220 [Pseudomonadota bacterium]